MRRPPLALLLALGPLAAPLAAGCVQLVAFEQPIVGQPDIIEGPSSRAELLCDDQEAVGLSAACDQSCALEEGDTTHGCGEALTLDADGLHLDPGGLREVELTLTVCAPLARPARIRDAAGASITIQGRGALVTGADGEVLAEHPRYLPEEDCAERTILLQDGRLELAERGGRLCSPTLLRFDQTWTIDAPGGGLSSVELCLRGRAGE